MSRRVPTICSIVCVTALSAAPLSALPQASAAAVKLHHWLSSAAPRVQAVVFASGRAPGSLAKEGYGLDPYGAPKPEEPPTTTAVGEGETSSDAH